MKKQITHIKLIETTIDQIRSVLNAITDIRSMQGAPTHDYMEWCDKIPEQIQKGQLKVAVVGVIKSGKSTFVNSLLKKEVVKRGAGVITSITTRIRKGNKNRATIYFRSWDDINSQLQSALKLFPAEDEESISELSENFDLRRKNDRNTLQAAYDDFINKNPNLESDQFLQIHLINRALRGFEHCQNLIQADEVALYHESKAFTKHIEYTADPDKAFYLKDVLLEVFGKTVDPHIEFADCQGADSTDPVQWNQILSYLESVNLIVYCVSSRTGLRASDISFLKKIKYLGLKNNILFINNCDLSEHENIDDLKRIEKSITNELKSLGINQTPFSLSALYNLFSKLESKLGKKDRSRLALWQTEKKMLAYCDDQTKEFNGFFDKCINEDRYKLLFSNHLNRLNLILGELNEYATLSLGLLTTDKQKEEDAKRSIEMLYQNSSRLESIVNNSLEGAINGLKKELKTDLNQIFLNDDTKILKNTQVFIQNFDFDVDKYKSIVDDTAFNQILYLMFQDFKHHFELYMINTVQPEIKKIILVQEKRFLSHFQSLFDSYQISLAQSDQDTELLLISKQIGEQKPIQPSIDLQTIKQILGIKTDFNVFKARYSPRTKVNVLAGFSIETFLGLLAALVNKNKKPSFSAGLKKASDNIKKENQKELKKQFAQFHQQLYANYFLPLIEAASRDFKEKIKRRFSRYQIIRDEMDSLVQIRAGEKAVEKEKVLAIKSKLKSIAKTIDELPYLS